MDFILRIFKRIFFWPVIFIAVNYSFFGNVSPFGNTFNVLFGLACFAVLIYYNFSPDPVKAPNKKLKRLGKSRELLLASLVLFFSETVFYLIYLLILKPDLPNWITYGNLAIAMILMLGLLLNGFFRAFTVSDQLILMQRICILLMWWIPAVNLVVIGWVLRTITREYKFKIYKIRLNEERKSRQICKTQYPLLMVHGIFFRDWDRFNYWGRIPKELEDNGATLYYGKQGSSRSVPDSAEQLKKRIQEVIKESGAEKVNIIAHSKGGLDSRYAISCLGMAEHVASLTTINTPHLGTVLATTGLRITPEKVVKFLDHSYDVLFKKLGDEAPDFFTGIHELTPERCKELNEIMVDDPGIFYQSAGTMMSKPRNAVFPLSTSYSMIHKEAGDNDGLVSIDSMEWGDFRGIESNHKRKPGIAHGDIIDLTRKDLVGFDTCEFYVDIVSELKDKGF